MRESFACSIGPATDPPGATRAVMPGGPIRCVAADARYSSAMAVRTNKLRVGRLIYLVLMLAALGVALWYFAPQYIDLLDRAGAGD
jgi:hypothetical protein